MTPLDYAQRYADLGIRVVPIPPGEKYPTGLGRWQDWATTDGDVLWSWWQDRPDDGVGLALGPIVIGIGRDIPARWVFAVDIDGASHGADGEAVWQELCTRHGEPPDTWESITGGGGRHLLYAAPFEVTNANQLPEGIDVRGAGGQIVVEPSVHPSGQQYQWLEGHEPWSRPLANAPDWLLDYVRAPEPTSERLPAQPSERVGEEQAPGDLWAQAVTWRQLLERDGWTLHHTDRTGEEHWTRPGKDRREGTSATVGYGGSDVLKVFTSSVPDLVAEETYTRFGYLAATRFGGDHRAAAQALAERGYRVERPAPDADALGLTAIGPERPTVVDGSTDREATDAAPGSLIDWRTLWDEQQATDWLLEPLFARGRGHSIYAGQKVGKSLLVASVLVPAALGQAVLGRPEGEPLRVLYLDYEMTRDDVAERVEAMGYGPEHADGLEALAYHVLPSIPPLDTPDGGLAVLRWAQTHRADLVIVDTLARAVAGAENDADTYRAYYLYTGMPLKAAGIATARLDHAGKEADRGQRGSSAKADDVDVVWKLTAKDDGRFTLESTHRRMGWVPAKVELTRNDDPLSYALADGATWPAGTAGLAARLAELGADLDITVRDAMQLLRENGGGARKQAVVKALQHRRNGGSHPSGTALDEVIGSSLREPSGTADDDNALTSTNDGSQGSGTAGTTTRSPRGSRVPPRSGEPGPGPTSEPERVDPWEGLE